MSLGTAFNQFIARLAGHPKCPGCGFCGEFVRQNVLWPELIAEWELSVDWARWFDEREGNSCARCGSNLRSGQLAQAVFIALKKRYKAKGTCLDALLHDPQLAELEVAEINSAGSLHQFLKKFKRLKYSEFGSTDPEVPSENLMRLSYADATFDLVITSETLEHVPDIDVALKEIYRILKPGGLHLFTVPIVWNRAKTRQRAAIEDGKLVHHLPPSYHGAPKANATDFLVFYEFGSDFVERCHRAEFEVDVIRSNKNPALVSFITSRSMK